MWNTIRKMRRRSWAPTRKFRTLGTTGVVAVGALILILAAGWILDRRGASAADRRLAELARSESHDPIELIVRAARAKRIVFLSDVHSSVAIKQIAARAVEQIALASGLDAVVVEIGADQQPYLDQYFDLPSEDASVLLSHSGTTGPQGSAARAYLDVYRAIWRLNKQLGAEQRIRVIAADLPEWPPAAPAPGEVAEKMAEREEHMEARIRSEVLATFPDARILVFMTGLHALKRAAIVMKTGGSRPVTVTPLAARLGATTDEVFSFLVDAPSPGVKGREVAPYVGTRVAAILQEAGIRKPLALMTSSAFDYLRHPVIEKNTPGIDFNIDPRNYTLRSVADAYIYLGN